MHFAYVCMFLFLISISNKHNNASCTITVRYFEELFNMSRLRYIEIGFGLTLCWGIFTKLENHLNHFSDLWFKKFDTIYAHFIYKQNSLNRIWNFLFLSKRHIKFEPSIKNLCVAIELKKHLNNCFWFLRVLIRKNELWA